MAEYREGPPPDPYQHGEHRADDREGAPERAPRSDRPRERRTSSIALIVVPLILIALGLVWFIADRGEPSSPIDALREREGAEAAEDVESPTVDIDIPVVERIETPPPQGPGGLEAPSAPAEPQPEPSPDPAGTAPGTPPPDP